MTPLAKLSRALLLFVLAAALVLPLAGCGGGGAAHEHAEVWYCPMHPEVTSDRPGSCPICHMDLVKREPQAAGAPAPEVSGAASRLGAPVPVRGVATVAARAEVTARTVRTVGRVVADERRVSRVESRYAGWIAELDADFTGRRVRRGERLATIDSPELYSAQREYLAAREAARRLLASELPEVRRSADDLVFAARRRLELLELPPGFLAELERSGRPRRAIPVHAPAGGFVETKGVVVGQRVEPGMALFELRDLSRVWIEADLYESDAAFARVGQAARIGSPYDPALAIEARASFVYPELDRQARTLRVRFDAPNPGEALKPGMFVDVEVDLGEIAGVAVPDAAVVVTGERTLVFVATSEGEVAPREVRLAGRQGGTAWIAEGLADGEHVVAEPAFLLDSESRLRDAAKWTVSGAPAGEQPAPPTGHEGHPR
ncbi:MAG TPA: efflux RND transporter periplasmic adaptor subunit [Thermoanaerobaculia bacterium]